MTYDDIVDAEDTTPEHAKACRDMWDKAGGYLNFGIYTPFFFQDEGTPPRSTIQLPGGTGGVNWAARRPIRPPAWSTSTPRRPRSSAGPSKARTTSYSFDANSSDQLRPRQRRRQGPVLQFGADQRPI